MPFLSNKLICDTALSKVGKLTYKFGGDNIAGGVGDCSDFTQWVYGCYNIDIGGNTDTQYHQGISVDKKDAVAGDLIFFKNTYQSGYTDGVSHVGIYLGNDRFVHLSTSGCKVSTIEGDYADHLLGFRHLQPVLVDVDTVTDEMITNNDKRYERSEKVKNAGLDWWGDIVRVIVVVVLIIAAVALLASGVGINIVKGVTKNAGAKSTTNTV